MPQRRIVLAVVFGGITGLAYVLWLGALRSADLTRAYRGEAAATWLLVPVVVVAAVMAVRFWQYRVKRMPWLPAEDVMLGLATAAVLSGLAFVIALLSGSRSFAGAAVAAASGALLFWVLGKLTPQAGWTGRTPKPGEIWWAEVPFEDQRTSKDRPCLVMEVDAAGARVLQITSQDKSDRHGYVQIPNGSWSGKSTKSSWVQVDRIRSLPAASFRRYAGPCDPGAWHQLGSYLHRAGVRR